MSQPDQRETKRRLLLSKWHDELERLRDRVDELEEAASPDDAMQEALETVRYWLLDVLVHHKPVSDPRRILQTVENAL